MGLGNCLLSGPESKGLKLQTICSLKYPVLPQRVPIRRRKEKANEEVKNARRYTGSFFLSSEYLSVKEEELSDSDYKKPRHRTKSACIPSGML